MRLSEQPDAVLPDAEIHEQMKKPTEMANSVLSKLTAQELTDFLSRGVVSRDGIYTLSVSLPLELRTKFTSLLESDGTFDILIILAIGLFAKSKGAVLDLTHLK